MSRRAWVIQGILMAVAGVTISVLSGEGDVVWKLCSCVMCFNAGICANNAR